MRCKMDRLDPTQLIDDFMQCTRKGRNIFSTSEKIVGTKLYLTLGMAEIINATSDFSIARTIPDQIMATEITKSAKADPSPLFAPICLVARSADVRGLS